MSHDPAFPPSPPPIATTTILPQSTLRRFVFDLFRLPHSHKVILTIALALVAYGFGHQTYHAIAAPASEPSTTSLPVWSRHLGSSVVLGYIVGWTFRTFLKLMATLTAATLAVLCLLSYFNITNVDFTAMRHQSTSTAAWIDGQAKRLRDDAMAHVHSTLGSIIGLALGARKRTVLPR